MKKLVKASALAYLVMLVLPAVALAQKETGFTIGKPDWVKYLSIGPLISNIIALILIVAALAFFFMLVIGGIQWMTSGGDKAATEAARGRITAALVGLIIVFAAWAIVKLLETFLGITIIGGEVPIPEPPTSGGGGT